MKHFRVALLASLTIFSGALSAATTDGTQGATSTGTADLSVVKEASVMISGLEDITFTAATTHSSAQVATSGICVYSSGGTYEITISSTNTYTLIDAGGDVADPDVTYTVEWADDTAADAVLHGATLAAQNGSQVDTTCGGSDNATLTVTMDHISFNAAYSGTFTDTITLAVAPE